MGNQRIIYYECENQACDLRFPDLETSIIREHCPKCRHAIKPVTYYHPPKYEKNDLMALSGLPYLVGLLDNVRSSFNVGSIFRIADGIGVSKLILGGITPTPDNPGVSKTSLSAERAVSWEQVNHAVRKVEELKLSGCVVWGLEDTANSEQLYRMNKKIPDTPLVIIVGNEVCGVDPEILALCDHLVAIPMAGVKQSYNVAIAFGIAASFLSYCQIFSQESVRKLPKT
jgi:23S rRNA (guanosine2251-2'-O)-methyltransferase